jgi:hypothetical protein
MCRKQPLSQCWLAPSRFKSALGEIIEQDSLVALVLPEMRYYVWPATTMTTTFMLSYRYKATGKPEVSLDLHYKNYRRLFARLQGLDLHCIVQSDWLYRVSDNHRWSK